MGFFDDLGLGAATPGTLTSLFDPGDLLGTDRAKKAKAAAEQAEAQQLAAATGAESELRRATEAGQAFLAPFGEVGLTGVEQAGFLTDPQAQFEFLQQNPLFQLSLDEAQRQTQQQAASRGRLSAGDTLQQLSQNVLLSAQPLISEQKRSIVDLLNLGSGTSRAQANVELGLGSDVAGLIQDRGDITAGGIAARNQIQANTTAQQNQLAATIFGAFSDPRLKKNKQIIGIQNGFNVWSWDWNDLANKLGLKGSAFGVMAHEVLASMPEAISYDRGFMKVDYQMIGVDHAA